MSSVLLKQIPSVEPSAVIADRIVGKPYLEIDIDREAIARYGLKIGQVQEVIEVAIGGKTLTRTVEGRERYPVRVRYKRELRDSIETLGRVLVAAPTGRRCRCLRFRKSSTCAGLKSSRARTRSSWATCCLT